MTEELETVADDGATLSYNVRCILVECHRDLGIAALSSSATMEDLDALATVVARRLAPRIGGRYVPKRDARAARDTAVWAAFNGRNHAEVMREFGISRRLFYSILSRRRRVRA